MRQFSHVNKSVYTTKVNESTEACQTSNFTSYYWTNFKFREDFFTSFYSFCFNNFTTWKDETVFSWINFFNFSVKFLTYELFSVTNKTSINHWGWNKSTESFKFNWKSTFNSTCSFNSNNFFFTTNKFIPSFASLQAFFRYKVSYSISIFTNNLTKNKHFKCFTIFNKVGNVCVTVICQFTTCQNTFDTCSFDNNICLIIIYWDNFSCYNVTCANFANTI